MKTQNLYRPYVEVLIKQLLFINNFILFYSYANISNFNTVGMLLNLHTYGTFERFFELY